MSYDEGQQARRSRVVVETPDTRKEVVHQQEVRTNDRSGVSAGMVGVLVVVAIALITLLVLFWMSTQPTTDPNANLTAQQTQPTIVQQPAQQPPVIIQQPAPVTSQPAPVIITPGAPSGGTVDTTANQDATVQTAIDKTIADDPELSTLGVTATVMNGKVTILGVVRSESLKSQVEQAIRKIKGVKEIDNQITVMP